MARLTVALGCLCILFTKANAAAVPTTETLVVSRADETETTVSPVASEVTTEGPMPPIKMTEMDVRAEVSLRYAHTAVVAHVRNPAQRAQEATFRVLLPETAFISGFVMTLDGKSYKAYVKEKAEAAQIYNDAVAQGIGAAHIATKARDSNHFTVSVNVEGNSSAIFNLTYEELLSRKNGEYYISLNLHPGQVVPKFTVTVHIKETQKISELRVPEIRTGNEIEASKDDAQNSQAIIVRSADEKEATITFTPDLEEQKRLISIYKERSKDTDENTDGVLGQFVVQYDVDRSTPGEVLVNDGYFVHFFAPKDLPPLSKHVIFVLDTSGSMIGRKIKQLKEAMQAILSDLNPGDFFSIVDFDSTVQVHDLKEADEEPVRRYNYDFYATSSARLVPPFEATPVNIAKAKVIVQRLSATGGTNIYGALDVATKLAQLGVGWTEPFNYTGTQIPDILRDLARSIKPAQSNDEDKVSSTTNTPVVRNDGEIDEAKKLEPIVIFLTDGDATVGETRSSVIIRHITEKNSGDNKATMFCLGLGEDADRKFLRKFCLRNNGFMRHIYEASDAALQLRDFYKQVSSPLLAHVNFTYPIDQVKAETVTKRSFRSYFSGSEIVVAGRTDDSITEFSPHLEGFCGVLSDDGDKTKSHGRKRYENSTKVLVEHEKKYLPLERIWAYLTIKQLLDEKDAWEGEAVDKNSSPEKKALDLALKYSFVTPLTSLVVVKPNDTRAVDAESVDKPHAEYQSAYNAYRAPASYSTITSLPGQHTGYLMASAAVAPLGLMDIRYDYAEEDEEDSGVRDRTSASFGIGMSKLSIHRPVGGYHALSPSFGFLAPELSTTALPTLLPNLATYHLEHYRWADVFLHTAQDSLVMILNETVSLKLTRDIEPPKRPEGDESCTKAVTGGDGFCVYLTRCSAAQNMNISVYYDSYCSVNGFAGVCCPQHKIDNAVP